MNPSDMVIPALRVREKKARTPKVLDIPIPVTADPGAMVQQVAMPNAKKAQKVSMSTAPEVIPGDISSFMKGSHVSKGAMKKAKGEVKKIVAKKEKMEKKAVKKAKSELEKMEMRKAHKHTLEKSLAAKDLSPEHVRAHIKKLRAEHKQKHKEELDEAIGFYRAEVKHEKAELRKALKDAKKKSE